MAVFFVTPSSRNSSCKSATTNAVVEKKSTCSNMESQVKNITPVTAGVGVLVAIVLFFVLERLLSSDFKNKVST